MKDIAKFSPLTNESKVWIQSQLHLLGEYFKSLDIPTKNNFTAEVLDELWDRWRSVKTTDSNAIDSFLNCFGVGFGQILVDHLGFEWAYLEDEYGSDIAVRALPGTANVRVVPLDFVLKRWESNEGRFVKEAAKEIDRTVDEFALEHGISR